ncbi:MAG: ASCH domain-containing protein [Acidobacteriaceae bacterium]
MMFTKRLRAGVRSGEITVSVRIWQSPRVKVGHRYGMEEGEIEIDSIEPIGLPDITPELARASGFLGVLDLLKVAQHGRGNKIYLVRFHYIPPKAAKKRSAVERSAVERSAVKRSAKSPQRKSGQG